MAEEENMSVSRLSEFRFKPKKAFTSDSVMNEPEQMADKVTNFNLPSQEVPYLVKLKQLYPDSSQTLKIMYSGPFALGTKKNYQYTISKFEKFCATQNLEYPVFSEWAVVHFIHDCLSNKEPITFYNSLLPALSAVERCVGKETSSITKFVRDMINGIKRSLAPLRKPTKKASKVDFNHIKILIEKEICNKENCEIDRFAIRSIFRMVIIFATMCRFKDFNSLQVKHFTFEDNFVEILFPTSKTFQLFQGTNSVIAKQSDDYCPVKIIRLYFELFNLENLPEHYVNFRLHPKSWRVQNLRLSYSNTVYYAQKLLDKHDIKLKYSEKSCKTASVTKATKVMTAQELMVHGRWKNINTAFHYNTSEMSYKVEVADRLFK